MKSKRSEYFQTPHGLVHRSCIHLIDSDQKIDTQNTGLSGCKRSATIHTLRALSPNAWKASANFAPAVPLGSMTVTFTVPEPPTVDGALIYLFPAAEDAYLTTILQPVLQWGVDGDGEGGDCWTIASWHVTTDGHTLKSPSIEVTPGDTIVGTVKATQCSDEGCDWLIETRDVSCEPNLVTALQIGNMPSLLLFLVAGALEAYPEDPCCLLRRGQFPASGSTTFSDIQLIDLAGNPFTARWNAQFAESDITGRFGVEVGQDNRAVTLFY